MLCAPMCVRCGTRHHAASKHEKRGGAATRSAARRRVSRVEGVQSRGRLKRQQPSGTSQGPPLTVERWCERLAGALALQLDRRRLQVPAGACRRLLV